MHRLVKGRYRKQRPNSLGHHPISELGVELGIWKGRFLNKKMAWLRWYDSQGRLLPYGREEARQARGEMEQERRAKEQAKREAEQQRQAKERAEHETEQQRQAKERAEREAEQERLRAQRLAQQLRALGMEPEP
jgi:hypothetical protein